MASHKKEREMIVTVLKTYLRYFHSEKRVWFQICVQTKYVYPKFLNWILYWSVILCNDFCFKNWLEFYENVKHWKQKDNSNTASVRVLPN
jgi:hypothetical protein